MASVRFAEIAPRERYKLLCATVIRGRSRS